MIDPRYLVRLDTLPPVSGAPTAYLCTECGAAWDDRRPRGCYDHRVAIVVTCLDLSAPPVRDGIPERLDALGWALAVLAKRVGWTGDIDAFWWSEDGSAGFASDDGPDAVRFLVQIWPDTIGLSPAGAVRALVAQALRTHVQTETSP